MLNQDLTVQLADCVGEDKREVTEEQWLCQLWRGEDKQCTTAEVRHQVQLLNDDRQTWERRMNHKEAVYPFWHLARVVGFLEASVAEQAYDLHNGREGLCLTQQGQPHPLLGLSDVGGMSLPRPHVRIKDGVPTLYNPARTGAFLSPKIYNTGFVRVKGSKGMPCTPNFLLAKFLLTLTPCSAM